jgi:uncharacterized iron-regulated membrane protein
MPWIWLQTSGRHPDFGKIVLSVPDEAKDAYKAYRMNFDIHTGQILGLPTKILAFLVCMIGASLPVSGTLIWYNRKWVKKKTKLPVVRI